MERHVNQNIHTDFIGKRTFVPNKGNVKSLLIWIALVFLFVGSIHSSFGQVVTMNGALSVSGNKIVNKNGVAASFAGNSFFWSNTGWGGEKFYNSNVVSWLKSDWNAAIVRVAMGVEDAGGYLDNPNGDFSNQIGNKARAKAVIDAAIANDMYVIIDWHTHHAEWNTPDAIAFFTEMAQTYGHLPNVMYEIYNEPLSVSWSGVIKPYAIQVIDAIRAVDPDNIIIVGTPTWSADVDQAANDPINRSNIAYTVHFYAASHGQANRDKCQYALNKGIAVVITEWGTVNADGTGAVNVAETNAWIALMKQNNLTSCNWSVNDKNEGASAITLGASTTGGWPDNNITWSGSVVKAFLKSYDYGSLKDQINFVNSPNLTTSKNSYTVKVDYTAAQKRDLVVSFCDSVNTVIQTKTLQIEGGASVDVIMTLNNLPVVGKTYTWKAEIRPLGGNASSNLASQTNGSVIILAQDPVVVVEAESYNAMLGIQTEPCVESGSDVAYLDASDWLSYSNITIPTAGKYMVYFRVASMNNTGVISLEKDAGATKLGTFNIPNTGGWQTWTTISKLIDLPQGTYSFGLGIPSGGYNINWIAIAAVTCSSTATITSPTTSLCVGGNVLLTASIGSSYKWMNGTTQVGTTQTYTATAAGSYTVEVTNTSACKAVSIESILTETTSISWYADLDNDGKGDPNTTILSCTQPLGYVSVAGDTCPTDANKIAPGNCGCGNTEQSCLDCVGVTKGTASLDVCNVCSGGTTGKIPTTDINKCSVATGIHDITFVEKIAVVPNPFIDQLLVKVPAGSTVEIMDMSGRLVYQGSDVETIETIETIETGSLNTGLYIVRIMNTTGIQIVKVEKVTNNK
jgi:endoglucanase